MTGLPRRAKTYAIDTELAAKHGVRRYGFHGLSHAFVSRAAAGYLDEPIDDTHVAPSAGQAGTMRQANG